MQIQIQMSTYINVGGRVEGRQTPAHALVAVAVPDRVLAADVLRVGEVRGRRSAAVAAGPDARRDRAAVVGRVRVVRLDVVVAGRDRKSVV